MFSRLARGACLALAALAFSAATAQAHADYPVVGTLVSHALTQTDHRAYERTYRQTAQQLGPQAVGRHILRQGWRSDDGTVRAARPAEVRGATSRLRALTAVPAVGTATSSSTTSASALAPSGTLAAIAQCESGGDPTAIGGGGLYRGMYQFSQSTWESVGGVGDPAAASVSEQTLRAQILLDRAGTTPWPVCGQ